MYLTWSDSSANQNTDSIPEAPFFCQHPSGITQLYHGFFFFIYIKHENTQLW